MSEDIPSLVAHRKALRAAKDFESADRVRRQLEALNVALTDTHDGDTQWTFAPTTTRTAAAAAAQRAAQQSAREARQSTGVVNTRERRWRKLGQRQRLKRPRGREFAEFIASTFFCKSHRKESKNREKKEEKCNTDGAVRRVLDVAGGHGDLSWALAHGHGIESCVVDPAPLRLSAGKTKWLLRPYFRDEADQMNEALDLSSDHCIDLALKSQPPSVSTPPPPPQPPLYCWQRRAAFLARMMGDKDARVEWLDSNTVAEILPSCRAAFDNFECATTTRTTTTTTTTTKMGVSPIELAGSIATSPKSSLLSRTDRQRLLTAMRRLSQMGLSQKRQLFDEAFASEGVFAEASVIVGLHPDEATEYIVDLALCHGKPFAVVPCCVFPSLFPGRVVPTKGSVKPKQEQQYEEVRTLPQFLDYLQAKHPAIKRATLPSLGGSANTVIYCDYTGAAKNNLDS